AEAVTESTTLSRTASSVGTPSAICRGIPGTETTSCRAEPESGATGWTSAEKSKTTRGPVGEAQVRRPVRRTAVGGPSAWAGPGAPPSASTAATASDQWPNERIMVPSLAPRWARPAPATGSRAARMRIPVPVYPDPGVLVQIERYVARAPTLITGGEHQKHRVPLLRRPRVAQ